MVDQQTICSSVVETTEGYCVAVIFGSKLLRASRYFVEGRDANDALYYYDGSYFRAKALEWNDVLTDYKARERLL